jgi:hypothetical protein
MPVQKGDYRTNRADYAIAVMHSRATTDDSDRDELLARKKKSLWLKDQRSARLSANPAENSSGRKDRPRG